jgi:GTPase involved in cell partitioning and DNA repair
VISGELAAFSDTLTKKPVIVVATKLDATTDHARLDALREYCAEHGLEFHSISAATGDGLKDLVRAIADALDKIPRSPHEATLDSPDDSSESIEESPAHAVVSGEVHVDGSEHTATEDEES